MLTVREEAEVDRVWRFTRVYGNPNSYHQRHTWDLLRRLHEVLEDCGLDELGFVGPCLTWNNSKEATANVQERLDRAVANGRWTDLFPNFRFTNLEFWGSDHRVVLLDLEGRASDGWGDRQGRGFKFEPWWLKDSECPEIILEAWANHTFDGSINSFLTGLQGYA
ncbi:Endonuclease/exonuclease/phosphatase [Trema orientale]|uniref:Endonuclease/exonuclease/phosphatase n=1 Tax=Trema orientale TaxID=63057 RepID=A0A2P5FID4_TREOI|nr:Endonuclease/exonuclease/phosphatase [Trema orientale]